jgi:hypothetical protein
MRNDRGRREKSLPREHGETGRHSSGSRSFPQGAWLTGNRATSIRLRSFL